MPKQLSYKCVRVTFAGGVIRRTVTCTDQSGAKVDAALCPGIRPSTAQRCNLQPCEGTCDAATTCLGRGTCAADGTCTCARGFSGPFCQVCAIPPARQSLACLPLLSRNLVSCPFALQETSNSCKGVIRWIGLWVKEGNRLARRRFSNGQVVRLNGDPYYMESSKGSSHHDTCTIGPSVNRH